MFRYCGVRSGKYCIGLCQYFQLVALCLHPLHDCLDVFYRLMVIFWRGRWCNVDILHRRGVTQFSCGCYSSFILSVCSVKKQLVLCPRLKVGRLLPPLSDVIVEHPCLFQKGDKFGHHHGFGDCLDSFSRKLSPLFQLFNQSGKGFRGIVGPHHLDCFLLEVDLVDPPYLEKICCSIVSAVTCLKPVNWSTSGDRKTGSTAMTTCFFKAPSTAAYLRNSTWFFRNFSVPSACSWALPML